MDQPLSRPVRMCLAIALGLLSLFPGHAAGQSVEYQVKAAYLLNFTRFIDWPPDAFEGPDAPLSICILGDDPFGSTLDQIAGGEVVNGHKVTVQRLKRAPMPKSCGVLYVGGQGKQVKIPAGLGPGVLTVGEGGNFIRDGGMIAFIIDDHRVRFEINEAAAESARFRISSKLLSIARAIGK
jgi:hypothetical protein